MASPLPDADPRRQLLDLLRAFVAESRLSAPPDGLSLDTRLETDLGLDSLGRAELVARVEQALDLRFPDTAILATTPRELLALAESPRHAVASPASTPSPPFPLATAAVTDHPTAARTLLEVLDWQVARHGTRVHVTLHDAADAPRPLTYAELASGAARAATRLRRAGLAPGATVALMLPTGAGYFLAFLGTLLAGGIPVPIYPPAHPRQIEEHLRRHARILDTAGTRLLVTTPEARAVARLLRAWVPGLHGIVTLDGLDAEPPLPVADRAAPAPDDLALLQYTSGSTGDPKGVMLSHADLLANIRAMGAAIDIRPDDVFVSWLPLYHDMGLIGAWLGSLYHATPLIALSPLAFLARPSRWLQAIHRYGGTLSAAPNFAYELCLTRVPDSQLAALDLRAWRRAFNGAEPVSARTLRRFAARFAPRGLRPEALAPVYGLAEAAVGLAFPPPDRGPRIDRIDRARFATTGHALPVPAALPEGPEDDDPAILEIVACGRPLPGYRVRIVDAAGRELPERHEGRLQFQGPSATRGYYRNPTATAALIRDGWHETGDRAYLAGGELHLTGRVKDLIIRGGRNVHPHDMEQALGEVPGARPGGVVAFAAPDPRHGSERLVIVAETKERDPARRAALIQRLRARATDLLDLPPDDVVLVPPRGVLKTSSGKPRRSDMRDRYLTGRLVSRPGRIAWQGPRLLLAGLGRRLIRGPRRLPVLLHTVHAWILLCLLAPAVWLALMLLPRPAWRWRFARAAVGLLRRLTAIRLDIQGLEHLPPAGQACVLVANHASYLDAFVLLAALPDPAGFVAKQELAARPLLRWPLERLGVRFVERFDPRAGRADAERLVADLRQGTRLIWFPEGTFREQPGLLPFRMGAFTAAARAGVPLIPVALAGTRACLTGDEGLLHPGRVRVTIGPALHADGADWSAASELRDRARDWMARAPLE